MLIRCDSNQLFAIAKRFIPTAHVALDIGPGIRPTELVRSKIHLAAEPFQDYIDYWYTSEESKIKKVIYINTDWRGALELFEAGSVDVVILSDVIEHLPKEDGINLLERTIKKLDPECLVVFTPLGFMPQHHGNGTDAWGFKGGGSFQEHKSGWTPNDFSQKTNYTFIVCEHFHKFDSSGKALDTAFGAFFAIYRKP
jgi:hypothetical protein